MPPSVGLRRACPGLAHVQWEPDPQVDSLVPGTGPCLRGGSKGLRVPGSRPPQTLRLSRFGELGRPVGRCRLHSVEAPINVHTALGRGEEST